MSVCQGLRGIYASIVVVCVRLGEGSGHRYWPFKSWDEEERWICVWANRKEPISGHQRGRLGQETEREKKWPFMGPEMKVGSKGLVIGESFFPFFQGMNKGLT